MQNAAKFPGIPTGIFLKTFPGIHEREFPVALVTVAQSATFGKNLRRQMHNKLPTENCRYSSGEFVLNRYYFRK